MWAALLNLVKKQFTCHPHNQTLSCVCAGREGGEVRHLMINLVLVHLEVINTKRVSRRDFGNTEYLTGKQTLPL